MRQHDLRRRMEDAVKRLIAVLDAMDGEIDLEGDEREADPAERGLADLDGMQEQFGTAA